MVAVRSLALPVRLSSGQSNLALLRSLRFIPDHAGLSQCGWVRSQRVALLACRVTLDHSRKISYRAEMKVQPFNHLFPLLTSYICMERKEEETP